MGALGLSHRSCIGSCAQWGGHPLRRGQGKGCEHRGTLVTGSSTLSTVRGRDTLDLFERRKMAHVCGVRPVFGGSTFSLIIEPLG